MKYLTLPLFLLALLTSCSNATCTNSNPILANESPDSVAYQTEVVNYLNNHPDNEYYIDGYDANGTQLRVKIVGDRICAVGFFRIGKDIAALRDIIQAKGIGYEGAELQDLKYRITPENELVLEDVGEVVD